MGARASAVAARAAPAAPAVRTGAAAAAGRMSGAAVQEYIKEVVSGDKVVVFSKTHCPYCTMAKEVFQKVKQSITVVELDQRQDGAEIQNNLASITGFRTVPQVFINGQCVGGGSDVKALYDSGKLQPMLAG